jgi:capsid assembly protease
MPLNYLTHRLFNTPLLISSEKINEIMFALSAKLDLDSEKIGELSLLSPSKEIRAERRSPEVEAGVGVVPVHGTLVYRTAYLDAASLLTSYNDIRSNISDMLESPRVNTILLDIDSGGGEGRGLFDLVDYIYSLRGQKPIIAISNESAFSAAYAIASAADEIYLSKTAYVGSIGVLVLHADLSERNRKAGINYNLIYRGARKADFNSFYPLSKEAINLIETEIDDLYTLFVSTVARNNGISTESILSQESRVYKGQDAVDIGLANGVMNFDEVFQYAKSINYIGGKPKMPERTGLQTQTQTTAQEQTVPIVPAENPGLDAQIKAAAGNLGITTEQLLTSMLTKGQSTTAPPQAQTQSIDPTQLERTRVREIISMCTTMAVPNLVTTMIDKGYSLEEARTFIQGIKAKQSEIETIHSETTAGAVPSRNMLLDDAERRLKMSQQRGPLV